MEAALTLLTLVVFLLILAAVVALDPLIREAEAIPIQGLAMATMGTATTPATAIPATPARAAKRSDHA
jgi:hypothetical protein